MLTYRAELICNGVYIDYIEFEADSEAAAFKYAVSRFERAYPFHTKKGKFVITELH
jgi:hypothetical protein